MNVIPEPLRDFYSEAFERCRQRHLTFDIDYECSSAQLYRLMHMNILPLKRSGELAFVNSTRVEHIHGAERTPSSATDIYLSARGMITMCCHCRRTRRQESIGRVGLGAGLRANAKMYDQPRHLPGVRLILLFEILHRRHEFSPSIVREPRIVRRRVGDLPELLMRRGFVVNGIHCRRIIRLKS